MKRIAIDSMVVDLIADTPGLLEEVQVAARRDALEINVTHILRDQLSATGDPERRSRLLTVYEALPKEQVPTRGFVTGLSKMDEGRIGDGRESGVSVQDVNPGGGQGGLADALIATTASGDADVLVTNDGDLMRRVKAKGVRCELWGLEEFALFVRRHATP